MALPVLIGLYDAAAVTASMGLIEGFDNLNFIIYYPTLLAFTLLFAGRWSLPYAAGTMLVYSAVVTTAASFDTRDAEDVKQLVTRLSTMAITVGVANLAVSIERRLRRRAIERALAAATERQRVTQEIHDGVAQSVYMLTMSLEAHASAVGEEAEAPALRQRLDALVRLSKQTLIETRALLLDLTPAMSGDQPLSALLDEQAREFATVTGVPAHVTTTGSPASLPPRYRRRALPRGAGGARQRLQAREREQRGAAALAAARLGHARGPRRRAGLRRSRGGARPRAGEHARAGGPRGRSADDRVHAGARVAGRAQAAHGARAHGGCGRAPRAEGRVTMAQPIRVLLVDDHELVRLGLRTVLEMEAGIGVVG